MKQATPKNYSRRYRIGLIAALFCTSFGTLAQSASSYLRDPALHNDHIVFSSEGDLWHADTATSGTILATRLSSRAGIESAASISPNGQNLAFIANYSARPAIYMMPTKGGQSKQLSFELSNIKLHGWEDDSTLLYSTMSESGMHNSWVLKTLDVASLKTTTLPLTDAVEGTISDNGKTLFFTQFGLQVSTDNANHYKGGASGELWRFELDSTDEAVLLTGEHKGSVRTPMLYGGRLFFLSNEEGIDNIWSMEQNGSDIRQHTRFEDFAVRGAYLNGANIVFQHGADIKKFNLLNNQTTEFDIQLQSDFAHLQTQYIDKPLSYLESANLANDGEKVVLTARGRITVADNDVSRLVNVAVDETSRNRYAVLSQDNSSVYAVSDRTGEYEIWEFDARGKSQAKQLSSDGNVLRTGLWLSPNGEMLMHTDKSGKLFMLDIASGENTLLLSDLSSSPSNIAFSKDSKWISFAYTQIGSERSRIYLRDIASEESALLTSEKYSSYSPSFGLDGDWLYFLSDRAFSASPGSPWGDRNMGQVFEDRGQIFAIALNKEASFPFAAPNELSVNKDEDNKDDDTKEDEEKSEDAPSKAIDWNNIAKRLWQVPADAANYSNLMATKSHLFVLKDGEGSSNDLEAIAFGHNEKLKNVTSGVSGVQLSGNAKHLLVQKGRGASAKMYVIPAKASFPKESADALVKLNGWNLTVSPEKEWQQIFKDAWLMHRDSLFDANMRGLDWPATKAKYAPLLARVKERSELNDIFEQMMGELNALHSQVRGGNIASNDNAPSYTTLGGVFEDSSDGVMLKTIYRFDDEVLAMAPPLAQPGVDAQQGDIVTAVNGQAVASVVELKKALLNQSGQQVLLDLNRADNALQTIVVPQNVRREARYRYQHWVMNNLNKVTEQNTDIGYLHLYAMGGSDLASFARDFYAQYDKSGLIIDVRRNRGGSVDSVIIEKLLRRAWSFWQSTNGETSTNMQQAFRGHLVVLADEFTYSDGETFTAGVRALNLGTVIGRETAGAGVWLSGGNRVVDGGIARVAEFPVFAIDGRWITEGQGISPDIEVRNYPHASFKGEDAQLQAALDYLQDKLSKQPISTLKALPFGPVEEAAQDIKATTQGQQ
jgi:tricorn protease